MTPHRSVVRAVEALSRCDPDKSSVPVFNAASDDGLVPVWFGGARYSIIDRGVKARQAAVRNVTLNY